MFGNINSLKATFSRATKTKEIEWEFISHDRNFIPIQRHVNA